MQICTGSEALLLLLLQSYFNAIKSNAAGVRFHVVCKHIHMPAQQRSNRNYFKVRSHRTRQREAKVRPGPTGGHTGAVPPQLTACAPQARTVPRRN